MAPIDYLLQNKVLENQLKRLNEKMHSEFTVATIDEKWMRQMERLSYELNATKERYHTLGKCYDNLMDDYKRQEVTIATLRNELNTLQDALELEVTRGNKWLQDNITLREALEEIEHGSRYLSRKHCRELAAEALAATEDS